jgi:hypothetical protein
MNRIQTHKWLWAGGGGVWGGGGLYYGQGEVVGIHIQSAVSIKVSCMVLLLHAASMCTAPRTPYPNSISCI